jgi:hypothetical protein
MNKAHNFSFDDLRFIERLVDNVTQEHCRGFVQHLSTLDKYKDDAKVVDYINKFIVVSTEAYDRLRSISVKCEQQMKGMVK